MSSQTVILVTGANSGVGYSIAKVISRASPNYHVIIGSRNPSNGEQALSEIKSMAETKGALSSLQLDVTDKSSIAAAVTHVEKTFGKLDVLVNNAGILSFDKDLQKQIIDTMLVNVAGPAIMTEAFLPLLKKSSKPMVIHISSSLGSLQLAQDPSYYGYNVSSYSYRPSKAALDMLTVQQNIALGKEGINFFTVCPGFVVSNLRGKDEGARTGGGKAEDPDVLSGATVLEIVEGKRDADVAKFLHKDGLHPY